MNVEAGVLNAMTVDVEEYFQVSAFEKVVARSEWPALPSRIEDNTREILDLFDEFEVHATFFVLGWIAERHPDVVERIAARGHEIACHGYDHRLLYHLDRETLLRETSRARRILQDLSGQPVAGYRAASFSIGAGNLWALDVLVEAGFTYDSSIFPIVHDRYGLPGSPRRIHTLRTPDGHELIEIPPSTIRLGRLVLPVLGGGYLRLLPARVSRWAIDRLNGGEGIPAVVYVHPWELDPHQPRIRAGSLNHWRHHVGIRTVGDKLRRLMRERRFGPVRDVIARPAGQRSVQAAEAFPAGCS